MTVLITAQQIRLASKAKGSDANINSVLTALDKFGADVGLDQLHRQVHYLAQLMHESGSFKWDQEIWGPTAAQQRYDTRTDLGNTAAKDGDGFKYRGRGPIQITGKRNYTAFRDWCRKKGYACPDFVSNPDAINSDPWEGLAPLWFWDEATGRSLNTWADQNDVETLTRKINGGKNGLADRIDCYGRLALVVCGYGVSADDVRKFQREQKLDADGDVGPKTRAALHERLVKLDGSSTPEVRSAPVVVETVVEKEVPVPVEVPKPVVPVKVEQEVRQKTNWATGIFGGLFGGGGFMAWLAGMDKDALILVAGIAVVVILGFLIAGEWIVRRVKSIRAAVEA